MVILCSACLLGHNCRYDGKNCLSDKVLSFCEGHTVIPVCPEVLGGLPTPRYPAERRGDKVISKAETDVTREYLLGAEATIKLAKDNKVDLCILKSKSPSCGTGIIYDGSFSGKLVLGFGTTSELLTKNGFTVKTENDL